MICPLCLTANVILYCQNCGLVFKDPATYLGPAAEKARYELHQNDFSDQNYRKFLSRIFDAISPFLNQNMHGLDFGCGPNKVLANIFSEYQVESYDPYFYDDKKLLEKRYDFLLATEVIEHFYKPRQEFDLMVNLLNNGGYLGVMTSILYNEIDFKNWYYKDDSTHVVFYRPETFDWIAKHYNLKIVTKTKNIVILEKKNV